MYESILDYLPAPPDYEIPVITSADTQAPPDYETPVDTTTDTQALPDYDIPVITNTDTQVYDLPVVTTDISVNTNPSYATRSFGEAQQPDTSHTYVNTVAESNFI